MELTFWKKRKGEKGKKGKEEEGGIDSDLVRRKAQATRQFRGSSVNSAYGSVVWGTAKSVLAEWLYMCITFTGITLLHG